MQPVAGELDRVKRGGAGGVEGEATGPQAERAGGEMRGQAGGEPVARIGAADGRPSRQICSAKRASPADG